MNMENFITGYPGHESEHRAAMKKVLGQENYEFFFDKWLEYFFTDADAVFFASLGLNALRLPFNYRHFEDDMNPRVLKEEGFKHLDRVIDLVSCFFGDIYAVFVDVRLILKSAPRMASTQFWTCTRCRADRAKTGTLITTPPGRLSGIIRTIKTAPCGYGK